MKKCPRCELNWIADDQDLCPICKRPVGPTKIIPPPSEYKFVIKNSISTIDVDTGYDFYDLKGNKLGVVFATHDKKGGPAYGMCEMRFYPRYEKDFRRYHRFKINGERLPFKDLQRYFETHDEKYIFIDEPRVYG